MKVGIDELDFALLKTVVENPGRKLRDYYRPFLGQFSENYLWQRMHLLQRDGYLVFKKQAHQ